MKSINIGLLPLDFLSPDQALLETMGCLVGQTAEPWDVEGLLSWFIGTCWQLPIAAIAEGLRQHNRATSLSKTILRPYGYGRGAE